MAGGAVGAFPGINNRRALQRAPGNPTDLSTVISIYPRRIVERKVTLSPGIFIIEPGTYEKPSLTVVGTGTWWKEIDEDQPLLEIPNFSTQVADALVKDYCNGLIGCDMNQSMPGLFWVPGKFTTLTKLKEEHLARLLAAHTKQQNYYNTLIKMANQLWAKTNGNPLAITDDMRLAARELNQPDFNWMSNFTMLEKASCPACGSSIKPEFPVCPTCRAVIDKDKAEKLGLVFAKA